VLLDALIDYGGTLIFVSHDRYFVEKLATKIIDVGDGKATMYPGNYEAFLWSKEHAAPAAATSATGATRAKKAPVARTAPAAPVAPVAPAISYEDRKRDQAEKKKRERAFKALKDRVAELEARIADREKQIKEVEQKMSAPDFYSDHEKSKPVLAQHQTLMWEVGELLGQWEMLQAETEQYPDVPNS
jgi:ATP-binding cassette subfamily F protein 3